jgi:diguanylate cyclase (GGDEF)-like protein
MEIPPVRNRQGAGLPARKSAKPAKARARSPAPKDADRKQLEYCLGHLAQYDVLTDLPNRGQFHDRVIGAMARAERNHHMVGIMLLNVDSFKAVNVRHGYDNGDAVLMEVAARLKRCTRKSDSLARLGGDEFAVILEGLTAQEGAVVPAQRALEVLALPMLIHGMEIRITATIGIALYPLDARDLDGLLRTADAAMCDAKDHERNTYRFYSPELDFKTQRDALRRAEIETKLARLTPREREVLNILISGKANKMIAYLLGASTRTIENHRAHIMDKMQANSLPELVRMVLDHHGTLASDAAPAAPADREAVSA